MLNRKIIGIMASDPQGVIGNNNKIPWPPSGDLDYFRNITKGQIIIMGRKTFETLPKATLKERFSIVFSHNKSNLCFKSHLQNIIVSSLEEFLSLKTVPDLKTFMIGGAEIAHLFLKSNLISEFILTEIHSSYEGDTFLDINLLKGWPKTTLVQSSENYTIYRLVKPPEKGQNI